MKKKVIYICIGILFFLVITYSIINYGEIVMVVKNFPNTTFRNILEMIDFLITPLLFIVTIMGLKEITVAKEISEVNAKREAFKLSAEQCIYYFENIIPKLDDIDKCFKENKITSIGEVKIKSTSEGIKASVKLDVSRCPEEIFRDITYVLNVIEGFSLYFISGVADERVAFSSVGRTYVNSMEMLLPIICSVQGSGYENVFKLYLLWKDRIDKQEALNQKIKLDKKMQEECFVTTKTIGF
ncbi:hypothetical protein [Clostridium isatidis]|uniref:Uncharacterized protein n=1 Tax=Clostridium isatidis TaxID=182773 RepID=A0A343JBE0_9CLOT|nr:hypothetical protein [Clostridium isatidis]ASW42848.1 hypothetical protein BEN51_04995 [Clostridium isatidis]